MPKVDDNRLKGNLATFLVGSFLSRGCLVRPVADGTDVGIDLLCETVEESSGEPFLHFWVQVKSGNQVTVCRGHAFCSLKVDHIRYWQRQPVPVYVFLISEDQLLDLRNVYVVSLSRFQLPMTAEHQETITVESDLFFSKDCGPFDLECFVNTSVRTDHVLLQSRKGICIPLPQLKPGYLHENIAGCWTEHAPQCIDHIRRSASATLRDILDCESPTEDQERQMRLLSAVLDVFLQNSDSSGHYEDHWAMGRWNRRLGKHELGDQYLHRAIKAIEEDEKFKSGNPLWTDIVEDIKEYLTTK